MIATSQALARRAETLQKKLAKTDFGALLVYNPVNVRYLSGLSSSNCCLLFARGEAHLFTDPRYAETARTDTAGFEVHEVKRRGGGEVEAMLRKLGVAKAGFEPNLPYASYKALLDGAEGVELEPATKLVANLRRKKDPAEVKLIAESQKINEEVFEEAMAKLAHAGPGRLTERQLANTIRSLAVDRGVDMAFETIVAWGKSTSRPHYEPSGETLIGRGALLIDMGVKLDGYCSDMTRMAYVGAPTPRFLELHGLVNQARAAAIEAAVPKAKASDVHKAASDVFAEAKLDKKFLHSVGHGLGLEIHEAPIVGAPSKDKLASGDVITIEPGLYLRGWGGIRIEDLVAVTPEGAHNLTSASLEPVVI